LTNSCEDEQNRLEKALKQFKEATLHLLLVWQDEDNTDQISELYPFKQSFEEVSFDIVTWVDNSIKELK
jgi:hypothetical protein